MLSITKTTAYILGNRVADNQIFSFRGFTSVVLIAYSSFLTVKLFLVSSFIANLFQN